MSGSDPTPTSAAEVFDLLWETLADILGTAATATLVRRAIKLAAARTAWSETVVVARQSLDYTYRLPDTWRQPTNDAAVDALRIIAAELGVLLRELTGPVVVSRLGQVPALRKWGIDFSDEARRG